MNDVYMLFILNMVNLAWTQRMSQKCPICPDIIWDMCYSMLIISGLLLTKFQCTHPIPPDQEFGIMCTPSKDTRRRRVYSQIKEEKEEKEKEGEKEEIVNGIYIY